jgi:hypothetical protein
MTEDLTHLTTSRIEMKRLFCNYSHLTVQRTVSSFSQKRYEHKFMPKWYQKVSVASKK